MHRQIIDRVIKLIEAETAPRRRSVELEERTGIPAAHWKQVWAGNQRPTAMMIQALALTWPRYAFWLVTGLTSEGKGHMSPPNADVKDSRTWSEVEAHAADVVHGEKLSAAETALKALKSAKTV